MSAKNKNSLETILTFENKNMSQWSITWSTTNIPGMDNATGSLGPGRRKFGRRRLRIGSLVLGALLTMHCRVAASALTGGTIVFMLFLIVAVIALANPLRHFEVYLGQWSISGPGRAFRIIPMLDGIGIAICINAIIRAINCCSIAAIASLYVMHSVSDAKLPFTYCRDFNLKSYDPIMRNVTIAMRTESRLSVDTSLIKEDEKQHLRSVFSTTVGLSHRAWRNASNSVELVRMRQDHSLVRMNIPLVIAIAIVWSTIWVLMVTERFRNGRLTWNKIYNWFVIIPWIWALLLSFVAISNITTLKKSINKAFHLGSKEVIAAISDALEVALYIHSVSVGTETIFGKGLNYYASGHIDPHLDRENMWHSALLLTASCLHTSGTALCAVVDNVRENYNTTESTLWILPMYSKCVSLGSYSHLIRDDHELNYNARLIRGAILNPAADLSFWDYIVMKLKSIFSSPYRKVCPQSTRSTLVFGGLTFSYMTVAYLLIKTALHTIFEYRVKLVFVEQMVVSALILTCMGLSLPYATSGGLALLESVDSMTTSMAVTYVCCLELVGFLYVYRSHDFISDMNISMEDSPCASRISWQWTTLPLLVLVTLLLKAMMLGQSELPCWSMLTALAPLTAIILAVPIRGVHNAIVFMRPAPRHGT